MTAVTENPIKEAAAPVTHLAKCLIGCPGPGQSYPKKKDAKKSSAKKK